MREILFRGKCEFRDGWVYGFYSPLIWYPSHEQTPSIKESNGGDVQIKPETLGQYTGRTDKNGKKIFEGDILEYEFEDIGKQRAYVVWDEKYVAFLLTVISENFEYTPIEAGVIIGNIYDNPELVEKVVGE